MERSKGITFYGAALIALGVYNLIGIGSYRQFSIMFRPFPALLIIAVYLFTIFYGICGVYCGSKILRLEDWARKLIVGMTAVSVVSGLLLNRTVMSNFREFLLSENSPVLPERVNSAYTYTVIFAAIITLFELSIVYFFTRHNVTEQFRSQR